jgi:hypothetical protein
MTALPSKILEVHIRICVAKYIGMAKYMLVDTPELKISMRFRLSPAIFKQQSLCLY